jgi:SAM-dependent methyltransferase
MVDSTVPAPCVICHSSQTEIFVTVPQVPVLCNILWPTKAEATNVRRVDIPLAFCHTCGHIFNPYFDVALMDYSQIYENSLHFSPRFQQFAETLAGELVERHDLHRKSIVEISCGKGDFLQLLCQLGNNQGYGFDPSYVGETVVEAGGGEVTFIQDFYSDAYAHYAADFLCCRHTLEHIEQPPAFMAMVRNAIGERQIPLYFEVPNVLFTLRDLAIWDIIYEHCGYFSRDSLQRLFIESGFVVRDVQPTYEGQFLYIEAVPAPKTAPGTAPQPCEPTTLAADIRDFAERYRTKVRAEADRLAQIKAAGQKAVIWGAGSKGITFLNMLQTAGTIDYAVDLNVRKQGMYITGTGQQIVAPAFLQEYQPDVVIVMNPIYLDEIRQMLETLGVAAELVAA